mgnify:CR=1 FL=1
MRRLRYLFHRRLDAARQPAAAEYNLRSGNKTTAGGGGGGTAEKNNNNNEEEGEDGTGASEEEDLDELARMEAVATPMSLLSDGDAGSHSASPRPSSRSRKPRKVGPGGMPDANGRFPCSKCSKVFDKVKSRNAHMKSHAMAAKAAGSSSSNAPTPTPPTALPMA